MIAGSWTLLPPMPLLDADSAQVESFESYLGRLAWVTGQPPGLLYRFIDAHIEGNHGQGRGKKASTIGPSTISLRRVKQVEAFTGQRLQQSTFWPLAEVLAPRGSGLSGGRQRRWCPECLAEDCEQGGITDRLIWNFLHYEKCGIHGVAIRSTCQDCGSPQPFLQRLRSRRSCSACRAPLGHQGVQVADSLVGAWSSRVLEDFVAWIASEDAYLIPQGNYERYMSIMLKSGALDPLKDRNPTLHKDILRFRRRKATVSTLLNLAALQGVTPLHLLTEPLQASSSPLFDRSSDFTEVPFPLGSFPDAARGTFRVAQGLLRRRVRLLPAFGVIAKMYKISPAETITYDRPTYEQYTVAHQQQSGSRRNVSPVKLASSTRSALHLLKEADTDESMIAQELVSLFKLPLEIARSTVTTAMEIQLLMTSGEHSSAR